MPSLSAASTDGDINYVKVKHPEMKRSFLCCLPSPPPVGADGTYVGDEDAVIQPDLLFTENDTNFRRLYGGTNQSPCVKDAFHDHIIPSHRPQCSGANALGGSDTPCPAASTPTCNAAPQELPFVSSEQCGTKSAAHYIFRDVPGRGGCAVVRLKLTPLSPNKDRNLEDESVFDDVIEERREEANEFYSSLLFGPISDDLKQVMRQALGGMLWTKQFYYFVQKEWIEGDPAQPPPPPGRQHIRNQVSQILNQSIEHSLDLSNGVICTSKIFFPCLISQLAGQVSLGLSSRKPPKMGISFFRCMGHGIPLHSARCGGPFVCKEAVRYVD